MITIKPHVGKIPIITACNNNFVIMAAALFSSIERNNPESEDYIVYLLSDGISSANKIKLQNSTNINLKIIEISKSVINEIELPDKADYLPKTAYFRLMIPELFKYFEKVIYLDIDTLVLGNLKKLWEINMDGKLALACQCFYEENHHGLDYFDLLGIDRKAPYFNSGMLVMDIVKWRSYKIREKVNDLLHTKLNKPKVMDEEGLNVILHNLWKPIDQRWNSPPNVVEKDNLPYILHFIGYKPIYKDYQGRYQDLFYEYLSNTDWNGSSKYGLLKKASIKIPQKISLFLKSITHKSKSLN